MDAVTIVSGVVVVGTLVMAARSRAKRLRAWRSAAEACGMQHITQLRVLGLIPSGIRGQVGPLTVTLESTNQGNNMSAGGTLMRVHGGIAGISLRAQGFDTTVQKRLFRAPMTSVGDPAFDAAVHAEGSPVMLQALLDQGTRGAVRQLLVGALYDAARGLMFQVKGSLRGELQVAFAADESTVRRTSLAAALTAVLDLGRRLVPPDDLPERLARNAREDPIDTVRLRNLATLKDEFPDHAATGLALRGACSDMNDVIRLYAATALGPEGHEVLRQLAASAEQESCAARAVRALGPALQPGEALDLMRAALGRGRFVTACGCIETLAGRGGSETTAALSAVLSGPSGEVAAVAARALGHPRFLDAEGILLRVGLGHDHESVRTAAAEALGHVGSVGAVLPLQEAAVRRGGAMRDVALQAVAEIQSRLSGAEPGQLSVAAGSGGAVSIASEGGEVSLAPEGGRVSIASEGAAPAADAEGRPQR